MDARLLDTLEMARKCDEDLIKTPSDFLMSDSGSQHGDVLVSVLFSCVVFFRAFVYISYHFVDF